MFSVRGTCFNVAGENANSHKTVILAICVLLQFRILLLVVQANLENSCEDRSQAGYPVRTRGS